MSDDIGDIQIVAGAEPNLVSSKTPRVDTHRPSDSQAEKKFFIYNSSWYSVAGVWETK
ncbi:MAG TPA: hypothetical protein VIX42_03790 [Edaphobacter sp.]